MSASTSTVREVRRARIILPRAEGKAQAEVAEAVQVNRPVVAVWERRFRQQGLVLLERYQRTGMNLADASPVLIASRLGIREILTIDRRDFDLYRLLDGREFVQVLG